MTRLLVVLANPEPDGALRLGRRRDQLPHRLEDLAELLIVLAQARSDVGATRIGMSRTAAVLAELD